MQYELNSFIESLKGDRRIISFDEAATKQAVVLKILSLLSWEIFNIDKVTPEYSVGGKRVDYSLRINNANKVFIEVKRIGEELENHQEQLLNYSFQEGVKISILTNGVTWWFYLPLHEGSWEQRKFYTIDVLQQEPEDVTAKFIDFISYDNIDSGNAVQNAEAIYKGQQKLNVLKDTLPKAWDKIISEPDEILIELISDTAEKFCGYKADSGLVKQFLSSYRGQLMIPAVQPAKVALPTHPKVTTRTPTSAPGTIKKGHKLDHILEVVKMMKLGKSRKDACRIFANEISVTPSTISDQCSRSLGLKSLSDFDDMYNKDELEGYLKDKFPNDNQQIIEAFK